MDSKLKEILTTCDSCNEPHVVKIESQDENILNQIVDIALKIRLCCSRCEISKPDWSRERHSHIDKKQLESFKILMAGMVDQRLDAHLEWTHAQNINALMRTFDLHCDELENQLQNPNGAIMSNNAMWVVLPYEVCKLISDALNKELSSS